MNKTASSSPITLLFVPGLRDHVEEHWQTLLANQLPNAVTVPPLEQDKLSCEARLDAIDQALAKIAGPVIIVAHSAGCMMIAHWAQRRTPPSTVLGAVLAAPADVETPMPAGYPTKDVLQANGWMPIPNQRLPFPSLLAASSNDPLTQLDRARGFAASWGSRLVELGPVGHLNPKSGHGPWPQAVELIEELKTMIRANNPTATAVLA